MGVSVRVGFKDSVGVQNGQNFPAGAFGAHGVSGAHELLRAAPLVTNCWPEAPWGGGVSGVLEPVESPPPPITTTKPHEWALKTLCLHPRVDGTCPNSCTARMPRHVLPLKPQAVQSVTTLREDVQVWGGGKKANSKKYPAGLRREHPEKG